MVRPGDVVVDVGTGTGVLALTAAMAGAGHVYALETTALSRAAQRMVDANGLRDRITVMEAHSFDVDLPQRADVLVSEIIGDDPLGERIIPTFADARARLLTQDARVIPSRLLVKALPVHVPAEAIDRVRFTQRRADIWRQRYGFDFSSLVSLSAGHDHRIRVNSYETRTWGRFTEALTVADLDLLRCDQDLVERSVTFPSAQDGHISGVLIFFEAELGAGVRLTIHPDEATATNSWGSIVHLLAKPIHVVAGEVIRLLYHFDDRGSRVELDRN
jgi:type I protein arginine methyltransferase